MTLWVLIALTLMVNAQGELVTTRAIEPFDTERRCESIRSILYADLKKERPDATLLFACVPIEKPVKA